MNAVAGTRKAGATPLLIEGWFPRPFRITGLLVLVAMLCFLCTVAVANIARIGVPLETLLYVTSGIALFGGPLWLIAAAVMSVQGLRRNGHGLASEKWLVGLVLLLWLGYILASILLD